MRRNLAQRLIALAGVAMLAVIVSLAASGKGKDPFVPLPHAVGLYSALASTTGPLEVGSSTDCDIVIGKRTEGVASPVLPCGMQLFLTFRKAHVLVTVIDRTLGGNDRQFDLTPTLARRLGLRGLKRLQWSYAEPSE